MSLDINLSNIGESLNRKADLDFGNVEIGEQFKQLLEAAGITFVKESNYDESTFTWYRIWSDGWCEQGGRYTVTSSSPHTINLFKTMSNTDYNIMICPGENGIGDDTVQIHVRTNMITTTSFGIQKQWTSSNGYYYWRVEGYTS